MLRIGKFLAVVAIATASTAYALSAQPAVAGEVESSIARGGLLYDKWYKVTGAEKPKAGHPAYPADKKYAKKPDSWRCKECHGWDYKGVDGAYKSGKHNSGIKGINGMAGADTAKIVAVLKDKTHALSGKMADADFQDLAMFVSKGQLDTAKYIDAAFKTPIGGDVDRGAAVYNTICARCHNEDGSKPKDMGKTLGMQMDNPWEVMHKIMNGHPGEKMPSLRVFGPQTAVDVLAHIATLPKKKL